MKKSIYKFIACFIAIVMLLICFKWENIKLSLFELTDVLAAGETEDGFLYDIISDNEISITGYIGDKTEIILPSKINNQPVTSIGEGAFLKQKEIEKIVFSDSIEKIGKVAFSECENLKEITLSKKLNKIGSFAFCYCKSLEEIEIPNNVADIGEYAFSGCEKLTKVNLPNKITSIEEGTFYLCDALNNIQISNRVEKIKKWAFTRCENLTNIILPESLKSIGEEAFIECFNISLITIPSKVKLIDNNVFNTVKIKSIYFEGVEPPEIKSNTFNNMPNLECIYVPTNSYNLYVNRYTKYLPSSVKIIEQKEYTVTFVNNFGKIIKTQRVKSGGAAQAPKALIYPNAKFIGWDTKFDKVNTNLTIKPIFKYENKECKVSVMYEDKIKYANFAYLSVVTVKAREKHNMEFVGWTNENGKFVSYDKKYSFCITNDVELYMVYEKDTKNIVVKPNVLLEKEAIIDREGIYPILYFNAQINIPDGFDVVECGTLRYKGKISGKLTLGTKDAKKAESTYNESGQYIRAIKTTTGSLWNVRAYLIYKDVSGKEITVYSDMISCTP